MHIEGHAYMIFRQGCMFFPFIQRTTMLNSVLIFKCNSDKKKQQTNKNNKTTKPK